MRRRLLLSATALVAIACVVLLVLAMLPSRQGVTKANFDRIQKGMTIEEVENVLGDPARKPVGGLGIWIEGDDTDGDTVAILFDEIDRVHEKRWFGSKLTTFNKLRRRLRL